MLSSFCRPDHARIRSYDIIFGIFYISVYSIFDPQEEAADKDAAKTEEGEPDFRTLPSVGTWFTGRAARARCRSEKKKG